MYRIHVGTTGYAMHCVTALHIGYIDDGHHLCLKLSFTITAVSQFSSC